MSYTCAIWKEAMENDNKKELYNRLDENEDRKQKELANFKKDSENMLGTNYGKLNEIESRYDGNKNKIYDSSNNGFKIQS